MSQTDTVRHIPRAQLFLSETESQRERRSRFDKAALAELGKSMATTGQINPIVVRPINASKFEIVAGERRYLGAGLAKLETVLCTVRELTDLQVIEVQLIENLQREDLHPLAEAEAYEALRATMSVEQIAAKVHRDPSYVAKRMRLLALGKPARKAFYDGRVPPAAAVLLARIPVPKIQEEVLEHYLEEAEYGGMSVEDLRRVIEAQYMTRLDTAPFDVTLSTLVKGAGACGNCPKNTASQGALFDDVKGKAYCTDTPCFRAKVEAHSAILLEKALASGRPVITGKQAASIAPSGDASHLRGFFAVSGHAYGKPVKKLLPKGYEPQLLQLPGTGAVIQVVPEKDIERPAGASKHDREMDRYRAEQRQRDQARELEAEHRRRVLVALHEKPLTVGDQPKWLRDGLLEFWRCLDADTKRLLAKVLGWQVKGESTGMSYARHFDLAPFLPKDEPGQWKLLRVLCVARDLQVNTYGASGPKKLIAAAEAARVDVKKIRAGIVAERKAKAAAKGKKKAGKK